MEKRIDWADNLKAIGIIFVVWGHAPALPGSIKTYIYSFHMPLFFMLSGLFFKEEFRKQPWFPFVKDRIRKRLIPYILFSLITYIFWFSILRHLGGNVDLNVNPIKPLIGIFYGNGRNHWLEHDTPLWFLLCLFVTEIMFLVIFKLTSSRRQLVLMLISCALVGYADSVYDIYGLPWSIDVAFTAIVFFGAGYLFRNYLLASHVANKQYWIKLSIFLTISIAACLFNSRIFMYAKDYGNYIFFYLSAFSGIFFWACIAKLIPRNRLISIIGRNTLMIYGTHLRVFSILTGGLLLFLGNKWSLKNEYFIFSIIYSVLALVIIIPISTFVSTYVPWLVGDFKKNESKQLLDIPSRYSWRSLVYGLRALSQRYGGRTR